MFTCTNEWTSDGPMQLIDSVDSLFSSIAFYSSLRTLQHSAVAAVRELKAWLRPSSILFGAKMICERKDVTPGSKCIL